jgi:predicted TIM-barrel fold metal-dependent hydrolase
MAYVQGRIIHDADSHLMELPDCLDPYLDAATRERFHALPGYHRRVTRQGKREADPRALHADEAFRAGATDNIILRKNYEAHGAFIPADRPAALDALGFASQLVFTTFCLGNFEVGQTGDNAMEYALASAHNKMMTDFCKADRRLLPTAQIPLEDIEAAVRCTKEAIRLGAKAIMVPSKCPREHSPSHVGLDAVWAQAAEAGIPVLFHVGGEDKLVPAYKQNGLPPVPDFHGGDDNFTSVSYMPIPASAMQTLATMIFDGVFDRFEALKFGAIELGAAWVPGWMRSMDSAAGAFVKNETRLQKLSAKPSEIVRRQFRVTPYPHEDAGWIVREAGAEVAMFSSDYPHIEGGRAPLKRFDASVEGCSAAEIDAFYAGNFIDMMGKGLAEDLRRPKHLLAA